MLVNATVIGGLQSGWNVAVTDSVPPEARFLEAHAERVARARRAGRHEVRISSQLPPNVSSSRAGHASSFPLRPRPHVLGLLTCSDMHHQARAAELLNSVIRVNAKRCNNLSSRQRRLGAPCLCNNSTGSNGELSKRQGSQTTVACQLGTAEEASDGN